MTCICVGIFTIKNMFNDQILGSRQRYKNQNYFSLQSHSFCLSVRVALSGVVRAHLVLWSEHLVAALAGKLSWLVQIFKVYLQGFLWSIWFPTIWTFDSRLCFYCFHQLFDFLVVFQNFFNFWRNFYRFILLDNDSTFSFQPII